MNCNLNNNTHMKKKKKNHTYIKNKIKMVALFFVFALAVMGSEHTISTKAATKTRYVSSTTLNLRKKASLSSTTIKTLSKGTKLTVYSTSGSWSYVKAGTKKGYVYTKYTSSKKTSSSSSKGQSVVSYAKKFVGNPYRWGGTSLTKGADCSGFTQSIFKHFGKSIPRTSYSQRKAGKKVSSLSKAKAGDLICYSGHVAIYMGNNKIVHASNKKTGIKISYNAKYRKIVAIRRIV